MSIFMSDLLAKTASRIPVRPQNNRGTLHHTDCKLTGLSSDNAADDKIKVVADDILALFPVGRGDSIKTLEFAHNHAGLTAANLAGSIILLYKNKVINTVEEETPATRMNNYTVVTIGANLPMVLGAINIAGSDGKFSPCIDIENTFKTASQIIVDNMIAHDDSINLFNEHRCDDEFIVGLKVTTVTVAAIAEANSFMFRMCTVENGATGDPIYTISNM